MYYFFSLWKLQIERAGLVLLKCLFAPCILASQRHWFGLHTHWVSEPWSLNADLLKESFVGHLGELVWQGSRYRLLFRCRLSCRQVHRLCCEGPLISGGRGGAHPASDKAYPAYHNLSLLITHLYPSVHCTALPPRWWAYTRWPTFTSAVHTQCSLEMISYINLTL